MLNHYQTSKIKTECTHSAGMFCTIILCTINVLLLKVTLSDDSNDKYDG